MAIINQIEIEGFKSIWKEDVSLSNINVFIGTNGAGKSNLLEAVGMLSAALAGKVDYNSIAQRGMRLSAPEVFRSAFANHKRKKFLTLKIKSDDFSYKLDLNTNTKSNNQETWSFLSEEFRRPPTNAKFAGRSNRGHQIQGFPDFKGMKLDNTASISTFISLVEKFAPTEQELVNNLINYAIYSPSTPILRGVANDESRKAPLGLYGGSLAVAFREILRDKSVRKHLMSFFALLDWFQSIKIREPNANLQSKHIHTGKEVVAFVDRYMPKSFQELFAYDVSEGALYILFVIALLIHTDGPKIFALDNIDNALNPGLVRNLMNYLIKHVGQNADKQIFITTHNPSTLDALDIFDEKIRLYIVKREDETGFTKLERIKPPAGYTKDRWADEYGSMRLSEIWLSGAFKGITPLKNF